MKKKKKKKNIKKAIQRIITEKLELIQIVDNNDQHPCYLSLCYTELTVYDH